MIKIRFRGSHAPVYFGLRMFNAHPTFYAVIKSTKTIIIYTSYILLLVALGFLVSCAQALPATPSPAVAVPVDATATIELLPPTALPSITTPPLVSSCARGALRTENEVLIGSLYPLSNPTMMTNGFAMQAAANLAVADINEGGGINGKPLRIIIYDSGSNPDQAALFAERMITLDCVAAIVGVFHSDVALAVKDVAVQYHIPVIFADPYADEVTADLDKEVFRIAPTRSMLIDMMGDWLQAVGDYNQDGEVFAVVLTENSAYGQARLQTIETELPGKGVRVAGFAIDLPTTDFSPIIARIVALDKLPDFVLLYLHNGEVMGLMKQLLDAGIGPERNTLLVATPKLLDDTQFWQQVPNGNYVIAMQIGPWHSTVTPLGQNFAQAFNQYFQRWPEASAFEAYDAVWLIADAIDRADSLAPDAVISTLEQTDITLASGHYTFPYGSLNPPDGTNVPHYLWHQWPVPQVLYLQYTQPNQPAAQMSVIWPPAYRTTDSPIAPALLERSTLARQQR